MTAASTTGTLLLGTAVATALFHTLIPDHWLPFVLVGRARGWSGSATALRSAVSGLIHAVLSIGLGFVALRVGQEAAHLVGESLERVSSWLLVVFGLVYAVWAWRKGGHFHPGGALLHGGHDHDGCGGGDSAHPDHEHYHADAGFIHGGNAVGGWWLALIVGANPCILILPILVATAERGAASMVAVVLSYSLTTIGLMVVLSVIGVVGTRGIRVPGIARYMEAASGLLIALLGVAFLILDHH